jgi:hypothetical protein
MSHADFTVAGKDAIAMVGLLYSTYRGTRLKDCCQVSMWYPRADIFLADAAAIKVRYTLARTGCIQSFLFAGGGKFSRQVSQTCQTI